MNGCNAVSRPARASVAHITADVIITTAAMSRLAKAGLIGQCAVVKEIHRRGLSVGDLTVNQLVEIVQGEVPWQFVLGVKS